MITITRTMNNTLIIGETEKTKEGYQIQDPFAVIPTEDGLRLLPLDIELTGTQMEEIYLSNDKVMYSTNPSEVIIEKYKNLLNPPETQDTETTDPTDPTEQE